MHKQTCNALSVLCSINSGFGSIGSSQSSMYSAINKDNEWNTDFHGIGIFRMAYFMDSAGALTGFKSGKGAESGLLNLNLDKLKSPVYP